MPEAQQHPLSRRTVLTGGAALTAVGFVSNPAPATASGRAMGRPTARVTVLGTTDLHGNVLNWDYFKNAEFTNSKARRHRPRQGLDPDQGGPRGAPRRGDRHPRRRRHHPGHPARLLLRPDRPHHRRRRPPDGPGHEPGRLRRGRAGQPRVQLRHRHPAHVRVAARLPAARCQRRRPGDQAAGLPAVRHQDLQAEERAQDQGRHPGPDQPRDRHLGPRQRRGTDGVPRPRGAGEGLRPPPQGDGLRPRRGLGALRRHHLLVVRRRAALAGERRLAGRRAGPRRRRDPRRPRARGDPPEVRQEREDRAGRAALRAALLGHAGRRDGPRRRAARGTLAAGVCDRADAQLEHGGRRPGRAGGGAGAARHRRRLRQLAHRHLGPGALRRPVGRGGRPDHRLRAVRPGRGRQGRAHRRRRRPAGALHRGPVQPVRVLPRPVR